jgi:dTDP-4-dehydrorhamnose reductase
MATIRYLVTGGSGQLARELSKRLPNCVSRSREELPVGRLDIVRREVARSRADVVFNCAAYNAVDQAEHDPEAAASVNAQGAANVAQACREAGATLVHYSTNYVFDGRSAHPYTETDEPRPLNAYGKGKREGEVRVLAELPTALVIRSSGLFGHGGSAVKGGSLPDRLLARGLAGQSLSVVSDQRLNPTFTGHLAEASIAAASAGLTGILHLVAAGCCSYHEFAVELFRVAGLEVPIEPVITAPGQTAAARPLNGCLVSNRAEALPSWQEGLRAYWQTRSVSVP